MATLFGPARFMDITTLNAIRNMTYDSSLRSLLIELEYERAAIERRMSTAERSNNIYNITVARLDLAQNRRTQRELADLADVERQGWTNDPRRQNVDIACSQLAAAGYLPGPGAGKPLGPSDIKPSITSHFRSPDWTATASSCCSDAGCGECRPVSPGAGRTGSVGTSRRWALRGAARAA